MDGGNRGDAVTEDLVKREAVSPSLMEPGDRVVHTRDVDLFKGLWGNVCRRFHQLFKVLFTALS
jgi:hypothetical protein